MMLRAAGRNIRWGVIWGFGIAVALSLVAITWGGLRAVLLPDTEWPKGVHLLGIIGVYLFGGLVAGGLVGLLRPALRWWLGRRIVGIFVAVPIMFGVRTAVSGLGGWTRLEAENWLITAVIWGFIMSFGPERWEHDGQRLLERIERERGERK